MDQLTITGTATYGSDTLTGTATINVREVVKGEVTATTTYASIGATGTTDQFVVLTNTGAVDVAARLTFATNKYMPFTVPAGCTIILPMLVNVNSAVPDEVEAVHVRTVSGTADVEYVVIR